MSASDRGLRQPRRLVRVMLTAGGKGSAGEALFVYG